MTAPDRLAAIRLRHETAIVRWLIGEIERLKVQARDMEIERNMLRSSLAGVLERADALAATLRDVRAVLNGWGIDVTLTGIDAGDEFAEAIHENGAWRFVRDLRAALDASTPDFLGGLLADQRRTWDERHGGAPAPESEEGCDCTELCEMGSTCPGGMLAGLPGSGCWRDAPAPEQPATCPCPDPLRAVLPRCPIHGYVPEQDADEGGEDRG